MDPELAAAWTAWNTEPGSLPRVIALHRALKAQADEEGITWLELHRRITAEKRATLVTRHAFVGLLGDVKRAH